MSAARSSVSHEKVESSKKTSASNVPQQRCSTTTLATVSLTPSALTTTATRHYSSYRVGKSDTPPPSTPSPAASSTSAISPSTPAKGEKELNTIYQLHHLAVHRYLELGWRVHWGYQNNGPALSSPTKGDTASGSASTYPNMGPADSGTVSPASGSGRPSPPPPTMTPRRASGTSSGAAAPRATSAGCLTSVEQCPFCAEEALLQKGPTVTTAPVDDTQSRYLTPRGGSTGNSRKPRASLVSSQPLPARLLSLQRWVETYMYSKDQEALRACLPYLSLEVLEYLATVGIRTGWMSVKLFAELPAPVVTEEAAAPSATAAVSFFTVPPLSELRVVSGGEAKELLGLPRFYPGGAESERIGSSLNYGDTRFFGLQERIELSKRRLHAAGGSVLLMGDINACDVFLVLARQDVKDSRKELTVWGRARRKTATRRASSVGSSIKAEDEVGDSVAAEASSLPDELFLLAHSLDDYLRLAAAFGWVYGWQLAYSSCGAPLRSLPWLRFFNASALDAALELHQ